MRLLLLEDDEDLGAGLADYLAGLEHRVDWCRTLGQARLMQREPFDALLVDWRLPDGSGVDWVRSLRAHGVATPVLLLTARDQLADRINGLDAGADDYLVKPVAPEELSARLRAITRRSAGAGSPRLRFGDVDVDLAARSAWAQGVRQRLTAREWALLEALVLRAGRTVPKADLEAIVMGAEQDVGSNAVEVHVSALRRKLGRRLIETVRGLGYRMGP